MSAPRTSRLDDFNRTNQGPAPSSSWTNGITTFAGGLVVLSNQLARQSTGSFRQGSYWNTSVGPDCEVWATVKNSSRANGDGMSLFARLANIGSGATDGYSLAIDYNGTTCSWTIQRRDNNSGTTLVGPTTQDVADGEMVLFQAYGSTISGFLYSGGAWSQVLSTTDSTYTAAGFIGVELVRAQTWKLDDFGGGTFPASGAANVTIR